MTRLMLFCTAWTVTEPTRKPIDEIDAYGSGAPETVVSERAAPEGESAEKSGGVSPSERPDGASGRGRRTEDV
jgi:membrane protein